MMAIVDGIIPDGKVTAGSPIIPAPKVVHTIKAVFPKTLPG